MKPSLDYQGFELGPIRPPSEAYSLMLRINRGCGWNRCKFCAFYRGERFRVRPVEHVLRDIDQVRGWIDVFEGRAPNRPPRTPGEQEACYDAMLWYQHGMESVFLQDANSMLMRPENLVQVLEHLNRTFPQIQRITTYGRSDTIAGIDDGYLKKYVALKLNRVHIGLETGCDQLLQMVNKGVTKEVQILAGQKAMAAGMEVNEFYMPGLGGRELARQSALDTADVLNQVNPSFIRIRSMALDDRLDLAADYQAGIFTRTNDIDDILEIRAFLEHLEGITSQVESDHILNILLELGGKLPEDKPRLLGIIDRFLSLPPDQQLRYRLGRRLNLMSQMDDLNNPFLLSRLEEIIRANGVDESNIDRISNQLMVNAIPIQETIKD